MGNKILYVNGSWVDETEAMIPFNDAGFLYGDGLFETIRFQNGNLFRPESHLARLRSGLQILELDIPLPDAEIISLLKTSIQKNNFVSGLLRLIITRGIIDKGVPWNHDGPCCMYMTIRELSSLPESPVKIVFLEESSYPLIRFKPAIKSVNYLGNMLAKKDAEKEGAYEPVFINSDGFITEGAIRNIFFINNNELLTPGVGLGVLPGIMRGSIMEIACKAGIQCREEKICLKDVNDMDEAFISSTGIGILPCFWDGWESTYRLTMELKTRLEKKI